MPLVRPLTDLSFAFCILSRSTEMFSAPMMPCVLKCFFACSYMCDECKRDFDGIQPTLRHVPPSVPRPSTQTVFKPSWPHLIADAYPPGPPPMTHTSYWVLKALVTDGTNFVRKLAVREIRAAIR